MDIRIHAEKNILQIVKCDSYEHKALKNYLNRHTKNYRFDQRYKMGIWDGKIPFYNADGLISLGLWKEVLKCCQDLGYSFNILNKDDFPLNRSITENSFKEWVSDFFKYHKDKNGNPFIPRDYQISAAYSVIRNRYCLVEVATSGGKSLIFSLFALFVLSKRPQSKILLIVPSISLVTQFYNDLLDYNYGFNEENLNPLKLEIEELMSDKPRKVAPGKNPNIYIGTYQSLVAYPKTWFKQFDAVGIDESHSSVSKSIQKIMKNCIPSAYYRFGMSGTFPDPDGAEILTIQSVTGPIIKEVKAHSLIDKGMITKVKIKVVHINHNVKEFYDKLLKIKKADGKTAYEIEKKYVQESEKRLKLIAKIATTAKSNTLVMFQNIEHGQAIYNIIKNKIETDKLDIILHYIDGSVKNNDRTLMKADMERLDKVRIGICSYGTFSTGISINAINNIVLADSYKSEQKVLQTIGRALRLHKDKDIAIIFDLVDRFYISEKEINGQLSFIKPNERTILQNHWYERKGMYEVEKYPIEQIYVNF